jgi:protein-S-isoprenylcysteine O-methyltransferase Ste14
VPDTEHAPDTERTIVFKIGGLRLTGTPAVLSILGLVGLVGVLLYHSQPSVASMLSGVLWIAFIAYWSATAKKASATKSSESKESRGVHENLLVASFIFLFIPVPGLTARFLPESNVFVVAGLLVQASFLLLAVWARRHLGRNWSGAVTVTVDHQLVRSGPYGLVRHPIYTAMLGMFAGTALRSGELHGLIALALLTAAYVRKIRIEENSLRGVFGAEYETYARTTWGLLPRTATFIVLGVIVIAILDILFQSR